MMTIKTYVLLLVELIVCFYSEWFRMLGKLIRFHLLVLLLVFAHSLLLHSFEVTSYLNYKLHPPFAKK
jgi:hypothetical protein